MKFDPLTSESRIITSVEPFFPAIAKAIYRAHAKFLTYDRDHFVAASELTHVVHMWERNRECFCEEFADYPDSEVRFDVTPDGALYLILKEQYLAWIKKSPDNTRVSLKTYRAQAFARQEDLVGVPPLERFFLTYSPNDDWSKIHAFVCYPRASGDGGFLWRKQLDKDANIHHLTPEDLDFSSDAGKYPFRPLSKRRAEDGSR